MNYINMPNFPSTGVVNYTTVLTSAPNEIYVSQTQAPDSLANLIKDNIIIEFSISPKSEESTGNKEKTTTSVR